MKHAHVATLDLGRVRGSAEVSIDGRPLGEAFCAPFRFDLGEFEGIHELEANGETHEVQGEAQEYEGEFEGELEYGPGHEMTAHEAAAEMMAAVASRSASEAEAEAMTGAAITWRF